MKKMNAMIFILSFILTVVGSSEAFTSSEYEKFSPYASALALPDRIAFWAGKFVGVPYDKDPLGDYVRRAVIIDDEQVDCMYLTFRAVELALGKNYRDAVEKALDMRFIGRGRLDESGHVLNYENRFQYGEDMVLSGKWGRNVTGLLSKTVSLRGSRNIPEIDMIDRNSALDSLAKIHNGDLIFFVKDPAQRKVGEIIGHMGIAAVEGGEVWLIHANGSKGKGGSVKKVKFRQYLESMPFVGIIVTRMD